MERAAVNRGHFSLIRAIAMAVICLYPVFLGAQVTTPPSSAKQILEFRFNGPEPDAIGLINQTARTVVVRVPHSQSVVSMVATFRLSPKASAYVGGVLQRSDTTAVNFTNPVSYLVTAEDGSSQVYAVTVVRDAPQTGRLIESFSFQGLNPPVPGVINQTARTIALTVPYSTDVTNLIATFTHSYLASVRVAGAIQVSGMTANNFTTGVIYAVMAEDSTVQNYTVTVAKAPISSQKQISDFRFNGLSAEAVGQIDESAGTIAVTIPYAAAITSLAPTFTHSAGSRVTVATLLQYSGISLQDFTNPLTYVVTAEDGSVKSYVVTVTKAALAKGNSILAFDFRVQFDPDLIGTIDQTGKTISIAVPYSQSLTALIPTFTLSTSAALYIGATMQVSGVSPADFTNPVSYGCKAEDGSLEIYQVTVTKAAPLTGNSLTGFGFNLRGIDCPGTIDPSAKTVIVHVPFGTDVSYLVPSFSLSAYAVARVQGVLQMSRETPQDFSVPVVYQVIAEDGQSSFYTVTVTVDPNSEKKLFSFVFNSVIPPAEGIIDEDAKTVTVHVPYSLSRSALVASFTQSANATVWIGTTPQVSGVTVNDFTAPRIYVVRAQDNSTQIYVVSVVNDPPSGDARILEFRFEGLGVPAIGVIDEAARTIQVTVPYATVPSSLVATFTHSSFSTVRVGSTIQVSGVTANNFTNPVIYSVTAENGTVKNYTVTLVKAPPSSSKQILSFNFEVQFDPDIIGVIDQTARTIRLTVPMSQDVRGMIASFTTSPYSRLRIGSVYQVSGQSVNDFTFSVDYTCEAEDGSVQVYKVSIVRGPASSQKDLLTFRFNGFPGGPDGVIDQVNRQVTVNVPGGTDVSGLVAVFTVSPYAYAKVGGAMQVSGITPNNFTNPVVYTVVAEDNSEKSYTVRVIVGPYSGKSLLTFGITGLAVPAEGVINETDKTVAVYVPFSTNRSNLVAAFTSSERSTVWIGGVRQVSGVTSNDFNSIRVYTVRAEDNSSQDYQVIVMKDTPRDGNQILTFSFSGLDPAVHAEINQSARTITATVPFGVSTASMVATFTHSLFASVTISGIAQVSGVTSNNFASPLIYRCTSESGLINEYLVSVVVIPASTAKEITYFAFEDLDPDCTGKINQGERTIDVEVPIGTQLHSLRAFFTHSPKSVVSIDGTGIQQSGVNYNDFRTSVYYRITAEDGTWVYYIVTVSVVSDYTPPVVTNLAQGLTNASGQIARIRSNEPEGKVYMIREGAPQASVTELDQSVEAGLGRSAVVTRADFDIPVSTYLLDQGIYFTYAVDAAGNQSARGVNLISVTDVIAPVAFVQSQVISNSPSNYVSIRSSDPSGYVYLILSGIPVSNRQQLDTAVGTNKGQRSVVTGANQDIPVSVYRLIPGVYKAYAVDIHGNVSAESAASVTVTAASDLKAMLAFSFQGLTPRADGQIVGTDIYVRVKPGTSLTSLVATFSVSPMAKVFVGSVEQVSGITPNNFTNKVVYKVEAEDGSTAEYAVIVTFSTGIEGGELLTGLRVWPNPARDRLVVETNVPASRIEVYNAYGQVAAEIHQPGSARAELDISLLGSGIYFVRVQVGGRMETVRFIRE